MTREEMLMTIPLLVPYVPESPDPYYDVRDKLTQKYRRILRDRLQLKNDGVLPPLEYLNCTNDEYATFCCMLRRYGEGRDLADQLRDVGDFPPPFIMFCGYKMFPDTPITMQDAKNAAARVGMVI